MQGFDSWSGNQDPSCRMALAKNKTTKNHNTTPKQANKSQREGPSCPPAPGRLARLQWGGCSADSEPPAPSALCHRHGDQPQECKLPMKYASFFMTVEFGSARRQKKSRKERRLSSSVSVQTKSASSWREARRSRWEMLVSPWPILSSILWGCVPKKIGAMPCMMQALKQRNPEKRSWCFSCGHQNYLLWRVKWSMRALRMPSKRSSKAYNMNAKQKARRPQSDLYCCKARWIPNCSFWRMSWVDHHLVPQIKSFHV